MKPTACRMEQRHWCHGLDGPGLPNDSADYPGAAYGLRGPTPSLLRFLSVIHHESPRYNHAFSEKTQHLWRWISLQMLTQGRLVPRQPWAIKNTTRTELRGENIHYGEYIHGNTGITPTALYGCNIRNGWCIHWNISIFCYLFIRMLSLIVL